MVEISNAFRQNRTLYLSHRKPINTVISEKKKAGVSMKRLSQAAQATANIHKRNYTIHSYYTKLAAEARFIGHRDEPKKYTIRYPSSTVRIYKRKLDKLRG